MSATSLKFFFDLNRAHAVVSRRFDAELGSVHGIGLTELQLLEALERAPEQRLRRVDLAQELGVTPSGVTWMLRPLIKRGLVKTEAGETDARVAYAVPTAAGRRLVAEALPSGRRLALDLLEKHVGKRELGQAGDVIERLLDALRS
jgi:DNA-binding MarR family transcriptional regulator